MTTPENTGAIGKAVRFTKRATVITDESITPSGALKVGRTRRLVREQLLEFRKRARKLQVVSLKHVDNQGRHTSEHIPNILPVVCLGDNPISTDHMMRSWILPALLAVVCNGCAVVAVADAAVTVVATGVKVGAAVVETTVDVAAAGVKAVVGDADDKE
jgi:hypothetical protein